MSKYIMVEGPDGAGKSTVVRRLEKYSSRIYKAEEPGGTTFGREIRRMFKEFPGLPPAVKFNLMFAARGMLKRLLDEHGDDTVIVSDRGFPSTFAYQIHGEQAHGLESAFWMQIASGWVKIPDRIILLDVATSVALERMKQASDARDVGIKEFDDANRGFKERVRAGYLLFADICNLTKAGHSYWSSRSELDQLWRSMTVAHALYLPPVRIIDTTHRSEDEVFELVLKEVRCTAPGVR